MEHHFRVDIAQKFGVNAAILLNNIEFWTEKNKANEKNYFDGRYWTYNSKKSFSILFPYMTERQVDYALKILIDNDIIMSANYNENPYDKTLWYSITDTGLSILQNCVIDPTKLCDGSNEIVGCNNTYIKQDKKTDILEKSLDFSSENKRFTIFDNKIKVDNLKVKPPKRIIENKPKIYNKKENMISSRIKFIVNNLKITDEDYLLAIKDWIDVLYDTKGGITELQLKECCKDLLDYEKVIGKDKTLQVIKDTMKCGWKSFSYQYDKIKPKEDGIHMYYEKPQTNEERKIEADKSCIGIKF